MEERIYDIRVKEGEKACDTDKCILKQDGTVAYMNHNGHWNHDTLIGCLIKLSIGTYRYIAKEKIDKKWNMTISNGLITIVGDRQMLRSRKKMNDKYIVTKVKEAIDKIKNVVVEKINNLKNLLSKHQLCLPAPISMLDKIWEEAKQIGIPLGEELVGGTWEEWNIKYKKSYYTEEEAKIHYIGYVYENRDLVNREDALLNAYKDLAKIYHPDVNKRDTTSLFQLIVQYFK